MCLEKYKSIVFSILVIIVIVIIHQIPIYLLMQNLGMAENIANLIDKITLNLIVVVLAILLIKKRGLWKVSGLSYKVIKSPYLYIILLFYLFIFTGGFNSIKLIPAHRLSSLLVLIFLIKSVTVGFLEEVVFRGLIQGSIIKDFGNTKRGIVFSVVLSGIIFGIAHIINIGEIYIDLNGVIRQVFAATCLGTLFGVVLLRTRNIYPIIFIHSAISFFSLIGTLFPEYFPEKIYGEKSVSELIASTVFFILLFGSAFIIAMFLIRKEIDYETIANKNNDVYTS